MWRALLVIIRDESREGELCGFFSSLQTKGIQIIQVEPERWEGLLQAEMLQQPVFSVKTEASREECLLLTDIPDAAAQAGQAGFAVVGLEWGKERIYSASYVLQGLEGIEKDYLETVYRRLHGEPLVIVQTERLCIRELTLKDTENFFSLYREAAGRSLAWGVESRDGQEEFLRAYIDRQYGIYEYGFWALTDRESGEWIGIAGAEEREDADGRYLELGYAIAPARRRQGYAAEACRAIRDILAERLMPGEKIKCFVPKGNIASQRTAQSIGMLKTEDIFEEFYCYLWML